MEHFERSFATSTGFCTELSEYNTQGLHLKFISGLSCARIEKYLIAKTCRAFLLLEKIEQE